MALAKTVSTVGDFFTKNVGYLSSKSVLSEQKERQLVASEHDFEDFGELLSLNDQIAGELNEGDFSSEDLKKYDLVPPRVIVVGLTSAGKSSLLERIIGANIFPIRDNVCTRRPFKVMLKHDPSAERPILRFVGSEEAHVLPDDIEKVRRQIESMQKSNDDNVEFNSKEIHAEIRSKNNETFTFTDLPGIFLVSETKMGTDYAKNRAENERLKQHTLEITKHYMSQPNTIVLVVISSTDWMHGMNNDNLISYMAEWLEEIRKDHDVPVYGVITKLDTQTGLTANSPIRKIFSNQLGKDHILHGLNVKRWIPVVSSPAVLSAGSGSEGANLERASIMKCLETALPPGSLSKLPIGRGPLLKQLKIALLKSIGETHGHMREKVDEFTFDIDKKLEGLPLPTQPPEKRRIFDARLKILETTLDDSVGPRGKHVVTKKRSFRMRLMIDGPEQFEKDLISCSLRGDIVNEVKQILNQASLEQGGGFDSDVSFYTLSEKIIERYRAPCLKLVENVASVIRESIREAVHTAFGDYKLLEPVVLKELGVSSSDDMKDKEDPTMLFGFLRNSASHKVLNLLEAFQTMSCYHPMWRSFDSLYQNILVPEGMDEDRKRPQGKGVPSAADETLQEILSLPALAKVVREEGDHAISTYDTETKAKLSVANKNKIRRHFARVEVMAYIIRMSLISSVFPLVLRDLRDGLFRGVKFGPTSWDHSVATLLRTKLVFDPEAEKRVFEFMEPSPEDLATRQHLSKKKESLLNLKNEFSRSQERLKRLISAFAV